MTGRPAAEPLAVLAARLVAVLRRARPATTALQARAFAAALVAVFRALQEGDTCVALADVARREPADSPLADADVLRRELAAAGALATDHADGTVPEPLPLALDAHGRLYLHRHRHAERRLAAALRARLDDAPEPAPAALAELRTLAGAGGGAPDWQAVAVAAAVRSRIAVVTGGPGTGKTTTIKKIVRTLLAGDPELQIALVAPTGKAAARMAEALADIPLARATTLHRLLGYLPFEDRFRRSAQSPLPHDVVVVDEASMVDLELMDVLVQALDPKARLILLGDRDQLSSVAAGQVLGDLCHALPAQPVCAPGLARFCRERLGIDVPQAAPHSPFADVVVALQQSHRFAHAPGIGAFARALAARDVEAALGAFAAGHADLVLAPPAAADELLRPHANELLAATAVDSPAAALALQSRLRILCATRHGPCGVDALNAAVERLLQQHGRTDGEWYRGRPLLITANDHQSGLYNGDLGVVWPDEDGRPMAWFAATSGSAPRAFLPLRLPPHETAWAMTVHKSQGSEFDEVLVVLPDRPAAILHAPLVYTAVTRGRNRTTVVGDRDLLRTALATQPDRASGLRDLLHTPPG